MEKRRIFALILMGLVVVILLKTHGGSEVNLLFATIEPATSMALLSFTGLGMLIGLLLK